MTNSGAKPKKVPQTSPFLSNRFSEAKQSLIDQDFTQRLFEELKEVTALYNTGVALNSSLNPKDVILTLYQEASRLIDTSNFALVIYDQPVEILRFALVFNRGRQLKPLSIKIGGKSGLTVSVVRTEAPIMLNDRSDADLAFELKFDHESDRPRSWLGVPIVNPLIGDESPQGALLQWSYEPNAFNPHDIQLLSAIGTQVSIALRNARLYDSTQRRAADMAHLNDLAQRRADEMAFLYNVARTLSSSLHLDRVLTKMMEQVEEMLDVEAGSLLLTDADTGDLVFQIALGEKADQVKPFRVPKGQGIVGQVAESGKPLLVSDAGKDNRHFKAVDETTQFVTRNILCVPLLRQDQVIGVLEVLNKKVGEFTENDANLLSSIASYAAIAIENARLYETLEEQHNRLIEAEQEARKCLARDLHDGPTQLIAAIQMNLDFVTKAIQNNRVDLLPSTLKEMQDLAMRASHQMRTLLFELRPLVLQSSGISAALKVFLERRQKDIQDTQPTKLHLNIETDQPNGEVSRLDEKVETMLFAIIQETVNNAIKHAQATSVTVSLKETAERLIATVTDDGVGFDVEATMREYATRGSLGMINLRERAEAVGGEFVMESTSASGTRVVIDVPKKKRDRDRNRRTNTGRLRMPPNFPPEAGG
ncbi:MAG TPA: GAF domain-containing sensor histidine kinase [Anaerolineae bacterium]|nr:GAF domain-containing sensor histidine kinase [Anaerolineae bacterium]